MSEEIEDLEDYEAEEDREQQFEQLARQFLSSEAFSRWQNIKLADEARAQQILQAVVPLVRSGRVSGKISEKQFKDIVKGLDEEDDYNLKFR